MTDSIPSEPAQTNLWRHPDFMKLWAGRTISMMGSSLTRLGLPLIAAVTIGASTAQMGILTALESAPYLLLGLFAGVLVDLFSRRTLMIASDLGRALLFSIVPVAALLGWLSMPLLYSVAFLAGILTVIFQIASQSYVPDLIARDQLVDGNSKLELSAALTSVAGPSLAGVIIEALTAPFAILLDAFSFLASGVSILLIRHREKPAPKKVEPLLRQVREGMSAVLKNPYLRAFAGCLATSNLASMAFFALYILFGTRELDMEPAALGLVYGIGASGAIAASIVAPRLAAKIGVGRTLLIGALLGSLEVLPVVFATPANAIPLLILSSLLGNFGWVIYFVNAVSIRQSITPPALLGRVNSTMGFIEAGMLPLGALAGGLLGEVLGLRQTITLAAAGSLLSVLWILFSPVRRIKSLAEVKVGEHVD